MNPELAHRAVVVIVGAGPTGTSLLERLVANLLAGPELPVEIVLADPHPPGAGRVWRWDQSPLLRMNSMAQDVTLFTDESVSCEGPIRPGPSLIEWVDRVRAGIVEVPPEAAVEAELVDGRSFPTRRLQSEYLAWVFRDTVRAAPPWVQVQVLAAEVVDVLDGVDGRQEVVLAGGGTVAADVVVLALGHLDVSAEDEHDALAAFARQHELVHVPPAYTADLDLSDIAAGATVITRGMGLAFVDLVVLLTEGRGGRFVPDGLDGRLRYLPSGQEPVLVTGSRRGVPYHAKTSYDLVGPRPAFPRFLTEEAVATLAPLDRPAELRRDLWPVVAKELAWGYYHELFRGHPERTTVPFADLDGALAELAWGSSELDAVVAAAVPDAGDRLDLDALDRPLRGAPRRSLPDLQGDLRHYIEADLARRRDRAHSADLGLFHSLLHCVISLPGLAGPVLSARSRLEELDGWWFGFFSYLASGPPPHRLQELLALSRAGVVRFLGADLVVETDLARRRFVASDASTDAIVEATVLVEARLPSPSVSRAADPLVQALRRRGTGLDHELVDRADGTRRPSGRLAVDATQRVRHADGTTHPARFAVGVHTSRPAAGAFARPGTNAPSFRQHDAVARSIVAVVDRATDAARGVVEPA